MNMHFEDDHDELERQLGSVSIVEPSDEYSQIPSSLKLPSSFPWWRTWPWVTASLLIVTGALYILISNFAIELDFPATSSLNDSDTENIVGVTQATSSTREASQSLDNPYVVGIHYNLLPAPVPSADQTINEVVAFFWYPCRPCDGFEQSLQEWERSLTGDTRLTRIPAIWSEEMRFHARAFFTAEALGVLDQAHTLLFREFERGPISVEAEDQLTQFFTQFGISANDFLQVFNSEYIAERLEQAETANSDYFVQSTPALYVKGRYYISPSAGGIPGMFEVADFLLQHANTDN